MENAHTVLIQIHSWWIAKALIVVFTVLGLFLKWRIDTCGSPVFRNWLLNIAYR